MHRARPENQLRDPHAYARRGRVSAMSAAAAISQHAMRLQAEVTYHDYEGVALYEDEQERMARDSEASRKR